MEKKPQNTASDRNEDPAPQGSKWPGKTIIRYITRALVLLIIFAWALVNLDVVLRFLGKVLALFTPFLIGGAIAFLINVVLRPLECCWNKVCRNAPTLKAAGSNPVGRTKNHRNRLIPVIFFYNLQLFMALNFCRFFKTHNLTHTGKGPESTGQGQTGFFLSGPVFFCRIYRICWLMIPPMVSAASRFICAVAWV